MDDAEREKLTRIYRESRTIAVVGASANDEKEAYWIPEYLQRQGYRIRPVNPRGGTILGEPVAVSLAEVDEPVEVVDVFRPAAEAPDIARQAGHRGEGPVAPAGDRLRRGPPDRRG